MSDLLTAKDVEVKVFKKVKFGGYSVPEVEDFLNQIADDLEAYTIQLDEKDERIQELENYAQKQKGMDDAIKDALIMARNKAQEVENQAISNQEKIIADAKAQAEKIISDAGETVRARLEDAEQKSSEIISNAKISADEILQSSQEKREELERSLEQIDQTVETRMREADKKSEEILAEARVEARKILADAQKEIANYEEQIRFLSLRKQQFLKDMAKLLLDFGKFIDQAEQETEAEFEELNAENTSEPANNDDHDDAQED